MRELEKTRQDLIYFLKNKKNEYTRISQAIRHFSGFMEDKMMQKMEAGKSGWLDSEQLTDKMLSEELRLHIEKGDPVDVANYCMMLFFRGGKIL